MSKLTRWGGQLAVVILCAAMSLTAMLAVGAPEGETPEPAPPTGQSYTGAKKCSSCHFEQYMTWRKTKHAKTFELLPAEYQTNAECLKCHTTGYGQPTGFTDAASSPNLLGTTCETCHGPGSKHEEVCLQYAKKKKLSPEEEKAARDSIWLVQPKNVCIGCHVVQGHKKNPTPKELQKK